MVNGVDAKRKKIVARETKKFIRYAMNCLGLKERPKIALVFSSGWAKKNSTFGQYDPTHKRIKIYARNRNVADILRTLAHELAHFMQDVEGRLKYGAGDDGSSCENEANSIAGVLLRKYGRKRNFIFESMLIKNH